MRRAVGCLLAAALLGGCGSGSRAASPHPPPTSTSPPAAPAPARPRPFVVGPPRHGESWAVTFRGPVALRARPGSRRVLARVGRRTRFGTPTTLAVVGRRRTWVGVLAPELGNGGVGWVRTDRVRRLLREQWRIDVDLSARRATLRRVGRAVHAFPVAVGAPAHPTPTGTFGVTDRLDTGSSTSVYGCCVLALSGEQPNVPQDWQGGDRLAIHGTNAPATIGTAASNGCLRVGRTDLRMLVARVPLGTLVVVRD